MPGQPAMRSGASGSTPQPRIPPIANQTPRPADPPTMSRVMTTWKAALPRVSELRTLPAGASSAPGRSPKSLSSRSSYMASP